MPCPFCQSQDTRVLETRRVKLGLRRRRLCLSASCTRRFNTLEEYTDDAHIPGTQYPLFPTKRKQPA